MRNAAIGRALWGLFILSGMAGLIYQSIWSHYLGLVLGHAAYAQTLVLGIFMGGMALGAWLASRWSSSWRQLILAYAVLELGIGLAGLLFHKVFVAYLEFSEQTFLPQMAHPWMAHGYQWLSGAALILPQCILLGMTFPVLSAAYLRLTPAQAGKVLGGLYFSNSLGAALGALVATYLLLPAMGMPGAMLTAGLLNILVALLAWVVAKAVSKPAPEGTGPSVGSAAAPRASTVDATLPSWLRWLLSAAAITGATSFVYEIGWVRMLNQALGTTIHSFELMLASFIFGLACGGWWVRRHSDALENAAHAAGWVQVFKGVAALLSVVVFAQSYRWMGGLLEALARNDAGYTLFSLGSAGIALAVMFPAAFFAGMTVPLFTLSLLRLGGGERQIGRVYAANTLGAIVGVSVMVHVLIPMLGLNHSVLLAATLDLALGIVLLLRSSALRAPAWGALAMAACMAVLALTWGREDPQAASAGVYRTGVARIPGKLHFFQDGKTATVAVSYEESGGPISIKTNGKPDAALSSDLEQQPTSDEPTMVMLGALPLILHPKAERIAVIGWGSGLTTHTVLGSSEPARVDTIEIEQAMVDGARYFGSRVERAYADPRSRLHIDDARTYFSTGNREFDVIISEPSNPWVSGVASLFTHEFYRFLRTHLATDGILVQWLHAYEMSDPLLAAMLAAFVQEFPDADIYVSNATDFLIVGFAGKRSDLDFDGATGPALTRELGRVGIGTREEFGLRRIGGAATLANYVRMWQAQPHSDFFPVVALNAPRARFKRDNAAEILSTIDVGLPVAEMLDDRVNPPLDQLTQVRSSWFTHGKTMAQQLANSLRHGVQPAAGVAQAPELSVSRSLRFLSATPVADADIRFWSQMANKVAAATLSQLNAEENSGLWIGPDWIVVDEQPQVIRDVLDALSATARRDADAMVGTAQALLERRPEQLDRALLERVLVQGQLGALAEGRASLAQDFETRFGASVSNSRELAFLRAYLRAWAAGHVLKPIDLSVLSDTTRASPVSSTQR